MKAVIGIGTNIGDRLENLKYSISALDLIPETKVEKISNVYETEPWGYENQDKFLNCAVIVETQLSPNAILGVCLGIEAGMGRKRKFKNGPRIIDLDLLLYENAKANTNELKLPHPGVFNRAFVLAPLADLFTDKTVFGYNFKNEYSKCNFDGVSIYTS